jgi:hypothetical protein
VKKLANQLTTAIQERRRLRSRSPLAIAIADRFAQLSPGAWESVVASGGGGIFHSAQYQAALERACPDNIEPRYALIFDGAKPVATMCMQIATLDLSHVGNPARARAWRSLGRKLRQRVLVCGNLLAYGVHGVCRVADSDQDAVWQAVAEVMYRVRRAEKLAGKTDIVLLKDFSAAERDASAVLAKLSYGAVETEPNMVLQVDPAWRTHEDYLLSLTSKYRSDIKNRIFKRFDEAGFTLERLDDVVAQTPRLQELYLQVHGNAMLRPFTLPADYWRELTLLAGPDATIHVARRAGVVLGFILTLRDGPTAFAYHVGFDRAAAAEGVPVYLRLLHASLAQAIALGCQRVSFGRTALEPKARLGCVPEPTYVWARHRHPFMNQLLQPMLRLIEHDEAPELAPFKRGKGLEG